MVISVSFSNQHYYHHALLSSVLQLLQKLLDDVETIHLLLSHVK